MKRKVLRTKLALFLGAGFALSMTTSARADIHNHCSNATAGGKWAFTSTGSLILPTGPVQVAAVATFTQDATGNLIGSQTRSLNGDVADETFTGKATVNSDCTATYVVDVFLSGVLARTTTVHVVFDDNARSARGIFTSLVLPNGASLPTVLTLDARRLFPKEQD
jgi:hypothetical protein